MFKLFKKTTSVSLMAIMTKRTKFKMLVKRLVNMYLNKLVKMTILIIAKTKMKKLVKMLVKMSMILKVSLRRMIRM